MNSGSHEEEEQIDQEEVVGDVTLNTPDQENTEILAVNTPDQVVEECRHLHPPTIPTTRACRGLAFTSNVSITEKQDDTLTAETSSIEKGKAILETDECNHPTIIHTDLLFSYSESGKDLSGIFDQEVFDSSQQVRDILKQGFPDIITFKNSQSIEEVDPNNFPYFISSLERAFPTVNGEQILSILRAFKKSRLEVWEKERGPCGQEKADEDTASTMLEEPDQLTDEQIELFVKSLTNSEPSSPQSQNQEKEGQK